MISLEILFELPKNKRMLQLKDIAQLDKLQRTWAIHLGGAPIHYYSLLAIWCLDSASPKKVYREYSKKTGRCRDMMEFHAFGGKKKAECLPLLMPQKCQNILEAYIRGDLCAGSLMSAERGVLRTEMHTPKGVMSGLH